MSVCTSSSKAALGLTAVPVVAAAGVKPAPTWAVGSIPDIPTALSTIDLALSVAVPGRVW